mmetsp:Transcript_7315/g.17821  ORF Transcript_7315/g.17821 Transcript_7315/m.17821 type:complete len:142 (-) Transcript_7315:440-865(-)
MRPPRVELPSWLPCVVWLHLLCYAALCARVDWIVCRVASVCACPCGCVWGCVCGWLGWLNDIRFARPPVRGSLSRPLASPPSPTPSPSSPLSQECENEHTHTHTCCGYLIDDARSPVVSLALHVTILKGIREGPLPTGGLL